MTARSLFRTRSELLLEKLALRQQLAVMRASIKRPRLRLRDRLFWVLLSRIWTGWKSPLVVVKPATVIGWHRKGFRLFWRRKSRPRRPGRPRVSKEIRDLVRRMAESNPSWGAPRIHGELKKLGIEVSERTVSNLMPRRTKPPSQTWRTFLKNHMDVTCAIDFFTVPTVRFRIVFVLIILEHSRRKVVHFNVTEHPCAEWTAQQVVEAFPWESAPKYLSLDRDSTYSSRFRRRVCKGNGNQGSDHGTEEPMAKSISGKIHRLCSQGLPGPLDRVERTASQADPFVARGALSPGSHALGAWQGHSCFPAGPAKARGPCQCDCLSACRWPPPSLRMAEGCVEGPVGTSN